MTNGLPYIERTGGGDWHMDITTLPIWVRDGDSAKFLVGVVMQDEVVPRILIKIKELREMHKHPRQIFMDNGSQF
jgi:hypothetical protein